MKLPKWAPDPVAWLNAVALYFFGMGVGIVFMFVLPFVFDLIERSPRLGWLALLLVWLSPIPAAAAIHRVVQGVLDAAEGKRTTSIGSLWAGLFAWMAFFFVNIATALIMLVIDPPPTEPDAAFFVQFSTQLRASNVGIQTVVWIVVAAFGHHLERKGRSTS
jgi:hypothetical protein